MELKMEKNYDHFKVEEGKFDFWNESGYFKANPSSSNKGFSMIIPPPNVTGVLHIGHALDATLHDIIGRYKKLCGYDVCFVPGTDHAGIATQARVEKNLREKGISRYDLGREKFLEETYKWTYQSQKTIHEQWKALAIGMDYSREFFTMNEQTNKAVLKVFKQLYDEGLIYKGRRIINWDVTLQTALSDIEVEHCQINVRGLGREGYLLHTVVVCESIVAYRYNALRDNILALRGILVTEGVQVITAVECILTYRGDSAVRKDNSFQLCAVLEEGVLKPYHVGLAEVCLFEHLVV